MPPRALIGSRPSARSGAESWVRRGDDTAQAHERPLRECFAARLTVDVTHELRGRIKIAAFKRGSTVANLVRQILQREFGSDSERT